MDTPICDFVKAYAGSDMLRLHMPGHKGQGPLGIESLDITEIGGADVLYAAEGIIRRSQANATALFGAGRTVYSAEGSSLCIRAMLYLAMLQARADGKTPRIAAGRNAHKVFMTAAALLDLDIDWIYPTTQDTVLSCDITPAELEAYLSAAQPKPTAVYITSPDYLGQMVDAAGLSQVCHRHGVLLLVDNAHGAYLHFLPQSRHPIALGADLCCDSAHKTLPVLTGGAYLHLSPHAPAMLRGEVDNAMALFASTSPSYLILQSLDAANRYLAKAFSGRLATFTASLTALKQRLTVAGYTLIGDEPLKLTIAAKAYGYTGTALAEQLAAGGIVCEFADPDYLVLMLTPENGTDSLARLEAALVAIPKKATITDAPPPVCRPLRRLSPRQALFAPGVTLPLEACRGRILASPGISCPPAVPIVVCGEEIDNSAMALLAYYGITTCRVVDEEATDALR